MAIFGRGKQPQYEGNEPEYDVRLRDTTAWIDHLVNTEEITKDQLLNELRDSFVDRRGLPSARAERAFLAAQVAVYNGLDSDAAADVLIESLGGIFHTRRARERAKKSVTAGLTALGESAWNRMNGGDWDALTELHASADIDARPPRRTIRDVVRSAVQAVQQVATPRRPSTGNTSAMCELNNSPLLDGSADEGNSTMVDVAAYERRDGTRVRAHQRHRAGGQ